MSENPKHGGYAMEDFIEKEEIEYTFLCLWLSTYVNVQTHSRLFRRGFSADRRLYPNNILTPLSHTIFQGILR